LLGVSIGSCLTRKGKIMKEIVELQNEYIIMLIDYFVNQLWGVGLKLIALLASFTICFIVFFLKNARDKIVLLILNSILFLGMFLINRS
jgi:hypothetical protein